MDNKKQSCSFIEVDQDKCVSCHMCISVCPVKFCNDGSHPDHIELNADLCLGCGRCLTACTHDARKLIDDFDYFLEDINKQTKMIAIVSPAVATVFKENYKKFNGFLKSVGIEKIFDISFGAELCAKSYAEYINNNKINYIISQPCPAIVNYIQHYKPELIKYLAKVDSPMLHIVKMIRNHMPEYYDYKIVAISPCIAKKREFEECEQEIYNVTYKSLEIYFEEEGIDIAKYNELDFDSPASGKGATFSSPKGLIKTLSKYIPDIADNSRTIEGVEIVYNYLEKISEDIDIFEDFKLIDCLNCELGCNGGPGTNNINESIEKLDYYIQTRVIDVENNDKKEVEEAVYKYWMPGLFERNYKDLSYKSKIKIPTENRLKEIFAKMHKYEDADIYNCASCGYNTCENMAVAIYNNLNKPENCHYYYNGIKLENSLNVTRMILNNADQGFFVFDKNLMVIDEYSQECRRILHHELSNKKITDILFDEKNFESDEIEYIIKTINKLLDEGKILSTHNKKIYLSLLPASLHINGKNIVVKYKILNHNDEIKMMMIITDISDKIELKERMIYEKNNLKMVVKAIVNNVEFKRNIKEIHYFFDNEANNIMQNIKEPKSVLEEIFRVVHTFKGDCAQWFMTNSVDVLENLENSLERLRMNKNLEVNDINNTLFNSQYKIGVEKDLDIIKMFIGTEFVKYSDFLLIKQEKIEEIEDKIETICDEEDKAILLPEVRSLRYRNVKEIICNYKDYIEIMASNLNKEISSFEIIGEENLIDEDKYYHFFKSLINIFRNIIDHGIENPNERILKNKLPGGKIKCEITEVDDYTIMISISDDGQGIDIEKIKDEAIKQGLYKEEDILKFDNQQLLKLVFRDNLSTKEIKNDISGRGIGLSAVKTQLNKIGGEVFVTSKRGEGTRFDLIVPVQKRLTNQDEILPKIAEVIEDKTKNFLINDMGLQFNIKHQDLDIIQSLELHELTAIISISGAIKGRVLLSLDSEMADKLVDQFIFDEVSEEEKKDLAKDVIAEALNTIIGNSTERLFRLDVKIKFSPPIFIFGEKSHIKFSAFENFLVRFDTDLGKFNLGFVRIKITET